MGHQKKYKAELSRGQVGVWGQKAVEPLARSTEQSLTEEQKVSAAGEEGTRKRSYKLSIRVPDCGARKSVFNPAGVKSNKI